MGVKNLPANGTEVSGVFDENPQNEPPHVYEIKIQMAGEYVVRIGNAQLALVLVLKDADLGGLGHDTGMAPEVSCTLAPGSYYAYVWPQLHTGRGSYAILACAAA